MRLLYKKANNPQESGDAVLLLTFFVEFEAAHMH